MSEEPRPGPRQAGQKRQQDTVDFCVYEYQRIPPFISQVPGKLRRTFTGLGVKSSCRPYRASRSRYLSPDRIKLRTGELHSIRGELSRIKTQVDRLLQSLDRMDQPQAQAAGTKDSDENRLPGSEGCLCTTTEDIRTPGTRACLEEDSSEGGTATEQAAQNPASDQEGSQ